MARVTVGDWYLPAFGELVTIYRNKDYINYALSLVGNNKLLANYYHWSSSERSGFLAWGLNFDNGNDGYPNKTNNYYYVRPVLAF